MKQIDNDERIVLTCASLDNNSDRADLARPPIPRFVLQKNSERSGPFLRRGPHLLVVSWPDINVT